MSFVIQPSQLPQIIMAIGGLGTAAFGLVDALKVTGRINIIGLSGIKETVKKLTPDAQRQTPVEETPTEESGSSPSHNALPREQILKTICANWVNGTDLSAQKAIAKTLIKLHLNAENATALARRTFVDAKLLSSAAVKIASGSSTAQAGPETALTQPESNVYARFDLIVTALLDEAYQHADQVYRNRTRALAAGISVVLALLGGWIVATSAGPGMPPPDPLVWKDWVLFALVGLLATPLAPIAKDLSTALATAVNTMQQLKK